MTATAYIKWKIKVEQVNEIFASDSDLMTDFNKTNFRLMTEEKSDGSVTSIDDYTNARTFSDLAAAQEWETFVKTKAIEYVLPLDSITII